MQVHKHTGLQQVSDSGVALKGSGPMLAPWRGRIAGVELALSMILHPPYSLPNLPWAGQVVALRMGRGSIGGPDSCLGLGHVQNSWVVVACLSEGGEFSRGGAPC